MKIESFFRFWLLASGIWISLLLLMGAKTWVFPLPFEEAWIKQRLLLRQTWEPKIHFEKRSVRK